MSVISYSERYGPEVSWLGGTYRIVDSSRFGKPVLLMTLRTTQVSELGSRGNGDGKSEDSCFWGENFSGFLWCLF